MLVISVPRVKSNIIKEIRHDRLSFVYDCYFILYFIYFTVISTQILALKSIGINSKVQSCKQYNKQSQTQRSNNYESSFFFRNFPSVCIVCVTVSTAAATSPSGSAAADKAAM